MKHCFKHNLGIFIIGVMLVLIDLDLTINNKLINIIPGFIGYIISYVIFNRLIKDSYKYLTVSTLLLVIINFILWIFSITNYVFHNELLSLIEEALELFYIYGSFTLIGNIAKENNYKYEKIFKDRLFHMIVIVLGIVYEFFALLHHDSIYIATTIEALEILCTISTFKAFFDLYKETK